MVDRLLLAQRLASIRDRLDRIERTLPVDADRFLADRDAQEIVAFNLFLAFQDALDIAAHVIADCGWELPTTAREHFDLLLKHGALP